MFVVPGRPGTDPAAFPKHPIRGKFLGKWQWTSARNGCTEVYDFRPGGKGCGDDATDNTSMENVVYVFFEPRFTEFIICTEPKAESCFGPLCLVTP